MRKKLVKPADLRKAIKVLNESGLVEKEVAHVGKNKDQLIKNYTEAVEKIDGKDLPDIVSAYYNFMYVDEMDDMDEKDVSNPFEDGRFEAYKKEKSKTQKEKDTPEGKDAEATIENKKKGKRTISKDSPSFKLSVFVYSIYKRRKTVPTLDDLREAVKKEFPKMSDKAITSELQKLRLVYKYMQGNGKEGTKTDKMIKCLKEDKPFPAGMKHTSFTSRAYLAYVEVYGD